MRCRSEARLVRSARAMLRRAASRAALALARRDVAPLDGFGFDGWRVASRSFASDGSKRKQPVNPVWRVVEDEVTTQPPKPEPPKPEPPKPEPRPAEPKARPVPKQVPTPARKPAPKPPPKPGPAREKLSLIHI